MSQVVPPLRRGLDIVPSADSQRPGLLIRDAMQYTESILYLPPLWALALRCLDGQHTELDLQALLTHATGSLVFGEDIQEFLGVLREQGFLETEEFHHLERRKRNEFAQAPERLPIHAGMAYPGSAIEVRNTIEAYFHDVPAPESLPSQAVGVAAPHVSPEGGRLCYGTTYLQLTASPALAEHTVIVLGTSHYGAPEKFGLTRKPFVTPLGTVHVDTKMVDWLEQRGGDAVVMEDYCHAIEHSIEFQCLFLQYALGPGLKFVPILCGPFAQSLQSGCAPESNEDLARFFDALGELADIHCDRLFWVLGIDLTHAGHRYGDPFVATAHHGLMEEVAERDRERLKLACDGDDRGFLESVTVNGDELKWCGYSALYTFMKALPKARGHLRRYAQWNIDPQSVVSFASLEFFLP